MKITVGQGTNVAGGFPYRCVDAGVLTENVVFALKQKREKVGSFQKQFLSTYKRSSFYEL